MILKSPCPISNGMNLLITTQKVDINDDVLGFFHDWLLEFAKNYKKVTVICLEKGQYNLPKNIKVLSLGKEEGVSRSEYIKRFYNYIIDEQDNYDKVFVHMNPEYMVLGGLFWRLWGKKTGLWYVHKSVDLKLKIAEKLANVVFTASKESFQLNSKKVRFVGHGIDVEKIKCGFAWYEKKIDILCVGRISPIKDQKLLIETVGVLVNQFNLKKIKTVLVGGAESVEDKKYLGELKALIRDKKLEKNIIFAGSVPNKDIVNYYSDSRVSVNLCPTGGMDKVVLESMSCGVPVVVFNKTFKRVLDDNSLFILENKDKEELAKKINFLFEVDVNRSNKLRQIVVENYSLKGLVDKIKKEL